MQATAVVFTGKDQVEVQPVDVRDPGPGMIQVRTRCTLISTGTECICLQRNFAPGTHWDGWVKYPFYPGYSNVGQVVAVGPDVTDIKVGQRVAGRTGHHTVGLVSAARAVVVPDGVDDEEATWFALAKIVQHGFRKAQLELGQTVVIVGLGALGQLMTQYAYAAGAGQIIVIDPAQPRLQMAKAHGATEGLAVPVAEAVGRIKELTQGTGADVVFDMTGHPQVFQDALKLVKQFGKLVLVGDTGSPGQQRLTHDVVTRDLQIIGAHDSSAPSEKTPWTPWTNRTMVECFFGLLAQKRMRVKDLITHRYKLEQAPEAYQMLTTRRDQAMGVIFDCR